MGKLAAATAGLMLVTGTGIAVEAGTAAANSSHPSVQELGHEHIAEDLSARIGALPTDSALRVTLDERLTTVKTKLVTEITLREQNEGDMEAIAVLGGALALAGLSWSVRQFNGSIRERKITRNINTRHTAPAQN